MGSRAHLTDSVKTGWTHARARADRDMFLVRTVNTPMLPADEQSIRRCLLRTRSSRRTRGRVSLHPSSGRNARDDGTRKRDRESRNTRVLLRCAFGKRVRNSFGICRWQRTIASGSAFDPTSSPSPPLLSVQSRPVRHYSWRPSFLPPRRLAVSPSNSIHLRRVR